MVADTKTLGFGFAPACKKVGKQVFLRGTSKIKSGNFPTSVDTINPFGAIPYNYKPQEVVYFIIKSDGSRYTTGQIGTDGTIHVNPGSDGRK